MKHNSGNSLENEENRSNLKELIQGIGCDSAGRCVHYHSELDILGNLCGACNRYYACYRCHAELENHPWQRISKTNPAGLCCGICNATFSYIEYACAGYAPPDENSAEILEGRKAQPRFAPACPNCAAAMNPGCQLHVDIYYLPE